MTEWKPTDAAMRVLVAIDEAGSAVLTTKGGFTRLLASGEFIKCMPETPLKLLAYGYLVTDCMGRLSPSEIGHIKATVFRDSRRGRAVLAQYSEAGDE